MTKTAGTSIVKTLDLHPLLDAGHHANSTVIKQTVGDKIWNEYFKFTMVRNPYAKMVSLYRYVSSEYLPGSTFSEFIRHWNDGGKIDRIEPRYLPWLDEKLNYIGKLEDGLQNVLDLVCDKVSIPRVKVLHENRSGFAVDGKELDLHYTEYYDDEAKRIVTEKFKDELERFNYQFED